ncbi:uncharacterized protein METZ01_LOCUS263355 [marine metagenome]|uniref:Uncharacterized protein n=1 Tax=marine metagenome TaxID=408172 RepID=A0A382JIK9_9ZZZZ
MPEARRDRCSHGKPFPGVLTPGPIPRSILA